MTAARSLALDLPPVTGVQFDKVFIAEVNAFREAHPKLRLNSLPAAFKAALYALWTRYEWQPGLKALEAEDDLWRDPLPPVQSKRRAAADLEGITTVQFSSEILALVDAFIASHLHLGFRHRRPVFEEGMRELFIKHGWVGREASITAARKLIQLVRRLAKDEPDRRS